MCFGAIKRKTQRFNVKSAGVTSTMLLFAVVGAFGPTLFYQIYGTHELNCLGCEDYAIGGSEGGGRDCRRCYFSQTPALDDRFYLDVVRPYCYIAAILLFLSYLIGLWFTLRTHAAVIWNADVDEKRADENLHGSIIRTSQGHSMLDAPGGDVRESHLYKRILGQSLKQVGLRPEGHSRQSSILGQDSAPPNGATTTPHVVPPKSSDHQHHFTVSGLSEAENNALAREVAEIAATAATFASRDRHHSRKHSGAIPTTSGLRSASGAARAAATADAGEEAAGAASGGQDGGHDAPNWSRMKSSAILLGATILYALIAEILVDTVDVVLESFAIDQKFLGITLFALVPNTTEFLVSKLCT